MPRFSWKSLDCNCIYHINLSEVFAENNFSLANIAAVGSWVLLIRVCFQAAGKALSCFWQKSLPVFWSLSLSFHFCSSSGCCVLSLWFPNLNHRLFTFFVLRNVLLDFCQVAKHICLFCGEAGWGGVCGIQVHIRSVFFILFLSFLLLQMT